MPRKRAKLGPRLAAAGAALALAIGPTAPAQAYSGEDMLSGNPWHHADITCRAVIGDAACMDRSDRELYPNDLGFSEHAAHAIAWNADYLDSYMYSPIWWISAGRSGQPVRNMRRRYIAGMANYWGFASLHFDDLTSSAQIEEAWRRYLSGALVGLSWAADEDDIQSAYNILGLALHANQDFYSHSTWINSPGRRSLTFLEASPALVDAGALMTGAYERDIAPVQHGKYSLACSIYNRDGIKGPMTTFCSKAFPTANFDFCTTFRRCEQGTDTRVEVDAGPLPLTSVVLQPPGIAMDNTYVARVGADQRGLADVETVPPPPPEVRRMMDVSPAIEKRIREAAKVPGLESAIGSRRFGSGGLSDEALERIKESANSAPRPVREAAAIDPRENCEHIVNHGRECARESDYLFAESKHLALISSRQFLRLVDGFMVRNHPDFWQRVKTCRPSRGQPACPGAFRYAFPPGTVKAPFEDYSRFPFQFMTAGHDAPVAETSPDDWFLRIRLDTATDRGAGTSADVRALTPDGGDALLDYLAMENPHSEVRGVLTYDDLESGDSQVYTIGPLSELPDSLTLFNDSSSRKEVRRAFRESAKRRLEDGFHGLRRTFRNTEDYIGDTPWDASTEELDGIIAEGDEIVQPGGRTVRTAPGTTSIHVDGGDEGHYRFNFEIARTGWEDRDAYPRWREYRVTLRDIDVLRESTVDGGSSDDEPFFFLGLSSYGLTEPQFHRLGPYENIGTNGNDRDRIAVGHAFEPIRIPPGGVAAVAVQAWESDNERARDRNDLWNGFRGVISDADREAYPQFISEWGRNLGGDWKLARMSVWGFRRGPNPMYGKMYDRTLDRWINEDQRAEFALDTSAVRSLGANIGRVRVGTRLTPYEAVYDFRVDEQEVAPMPMKTPAAGDAAKEKIKERVRTPSPLPRGIRKDVPALKKKD